MTKDKKIGKGGMLGSLRVRLRGRSNSQGSVVPSKPKTARTKSKLAAACVLNTTPILPQPISASITTTTTSISEDLKLQDSVKKFNGDDANETSTGNDNSGGAMTRSQSRKRRISNLRHSWPPSETLSGKENARNRKDGKIEDSKGICLLDLKVGEKLAEGFFGSVYRAVHQPSGRLLVLKELKPDHSDRAAFVGEISMLKMLSHPNILQYVGMFCKDKKLHLVTEHISGGTLANRIEKTEVELSYDQRIAHALDLAQGMAYLHSKKIIHRDLKSENCMLRADGTVVVVDFGFARVMEGQTIKTVAPSTPITKRRPRRRISISNLDVGHSIHRKQRPRPMSIVGSPYWMAPEIIFCNDGYGYPADVFSFGVVLCELIGRISADPDIMPRTTSFGIDEEAFAEQFASECPDKLLQLAFRCCKIDVMLRPSFSKIETGLRTLWMKQNPAAPEPRLKLKRKPSFDSNTQPEKLGIKLMPGLPTTTTTTPFVNDEGNDDNGIVPVSPVAATPRLPQRIITEL